MYAELKNLYIKQSELDEEIARNHNVTYPSTHNRRIMALLVELGELANATRCFKFWSLKPSESKERVLDEYADGLHFLLSLGIDIHTQYSGFDIIINDNQPTEQFLKVYETVNDFAANPIDDNYKKAFESYLSLLPVLGFTWEEAEDAYYKKL